MIDVYWQTYQKLLICQCIGCFGLEAESDQGYWQTCLQKIKCSVPASNEMQQA
jgi:hypothetical protein